MVTLDQAASVFNVAGVAILLAVSIHMARHHDAPFFRDWTLAYGSGLGIFLFEVAGTFYGHGIALSLAEATLIYSVAFLNVRVGLRTGDGELRRGLYLPGLVIALGTTLIGLAFHKPFHQAALVPLAFITGSFIWLGATLHRNPTVPPHAKVWLAWPLMLKALLPLAYPLIVATPYGWLGYLAGALLNLMTGTGMLVLVLERTADTLRARNAEVAELYTFKLEAERVRYLEIAARLARSEADDLTVANLVLLRDSERLTEEHGQLADSLGALREEGMRKDDFFSMVSHELRTPLTAIKNAASILQRGRAGPLVPDQTRFVGVIADHTQRLQNLVDGILDFQKLGSGTTQYDRQRQDVVACVREAVRGFEHVLDAQGITLALEVPPTPILADCDATRLAQVVLNLLSNAAKFTALGGRITVSVRAVTHDGAPAVEVAVGDTGAGIQPADLARIFEKYEQSERPSGDRGVGLGLTICRMIIEDGHQGHIRAASTPGAGSVFTFSLPVEAPVAESAAAR